MADPDAAAPHGTPADLAEQLMGFAEGCRKAAAVALAEGRNGDADVWRGFGLRWESLARRASEEGLRQLEAAAAEGGS